MGVIHVVICIFSMSWIDFIRVELNNRTKISLEIIIIDEIFFASDE